MKNMLCAAALSLCLSSMVSAQECALSVSQPVVDYGQAQRAQLLEGAREGQRLLVGTRVVTLNLSCTESTAMALSFIGEAVGSEGYRFAQEGMFTLKVLSAQLDGQPVRMAQRSAGASAQGVSDTLQPGVSLVPMASGQIARGAKLSAQVEVKTYVHDRDTEARSRDEWGGGGQFSVNTD